MPCFFPVDAFELEGGGRPSFDPYHPLRIRAIKLPCHQCRGCRMQRASMMGMRCMHEASLYGINNSFITLTYDDEHLPEGGTLVKRDFQLFMKRLRYEFRDTRVRFLGVGEYGDRSDRPHYHALIFNHRFDRSRQPVSSGKDGKTYMSEELKKLWPYGMSSTGDLTFRSAGYVCRYALKKRSENGLAVRVIDADGVITMLEPEFSLMSTHPGLGTGWLQKYQQHTFAWDHVIVNGKERPVPAYYDRLFERWGGDIETVKFARELKARRHAADNTPERLDVRERVAEAREAMLKRSL